MRITEVKVVPRPFNNDTRLATWRTPARIYIWVEGESLLQNLENRTVRPYTVYRNEVIPQLVGRGILKDEDRVRWSQKAGCAMCPCSPGFILSRMYRDEKGMPSDIHVTVVGNDAAIAEGETPRDILGRMVCVEVPGEGRIT